MAKYLITAYDYTDAGAPDHRMEVRPRHLENINHVKTYGSVVCAGGFTNEEGKTIGSYLVLDFPESAGLDYYLSHEPYILEGVWEKYHVQPCNVVIQNDERVGK